jgi:F-type H+-transporting ATPase subunit gamma
MANIRQIRRQIKAVQSTAKITRAMEMIATSKMKRAQEAGLAGRAYAEKIQQVLSDLAALPPDGTSHPLLERREAKKIAIVHITPDRGLSGGLHAVLNRATLGFIAQEKLPATLINVGRKGVDYMRRYYPDVTAEFTSLGDRPKLIDTYPISHIIVEDYAKGKFDRVYILYAQFISTTVQKPRFLQILPVEPATAHGGSQNVDFLYEPNPSQVLDALLPRFVEMEVYHAILEAIASEQSARVVAMRNATDNANELVQNLTLLYNKARQEAITKELLEIVGGAAALG